jgi:hypothetical protein
MASPRGARNRGGRARGRFSPLELAIGFALIGSLLAIVVPTFARELHASRLVEPVGGLQRLGSAAVAYAQSRPVVEAFPPAAPLTPGAVPRGRCEVDLPAAWSHPTWLALDFTPGPAGVPHCFAFTFDSALAPPRSTFRARAHGDLDGDGIPSTFEITGHVAEGDPAGAVVDPGMFIDSEVE